MSAALEPASYPARVACPIGELLKPEPWVTVVPFGEVVFDVDWPAPLSERVLRSAICGQLGPNAHVDFHQHADGPEDERRMACPAVMYRIRNGRPGVWLWGPRAGENVMTLARLNVLEVPNGERLTIRGAELRIDECPVSVHRKGRWNRYRLATPFFPPSVTSARQPGSGADSEVWGAWAGGTLARSLSAWLRDEVALDGEQLHVHMVRWRTAKCSWARPSRGVGYAATGFEAEFLANVAIPDGLALGKHRAEGWGEIRAC